MKIVIEIFFCWYLNVQSIILFKGFKGIVEEGIWRNFLILERIAR
uniref:Uncharacterized protein n=1 Tax=Ascaris lumbricoides TaxID=6252 RepID=A0A0M3ING1_ASCLU